MEMAKPNLADFKIDFFAPDFSLDNQFQTTVSIGVASPGGCVIPVIIPAVLSPSIGGAASCINSGNCNAFPVITLSGPLTSPIVQSDTLNRFISLNTTLAVGNQIVIDMKNKTIMQGSTPILGNVVSGSNWFWLNAGSNLLRLITSDVTDAGNISIVYRDAYLGI
jgi:hypothetical protein